MVHAVLSSIDQQHHLLLGEWDLLPRSPVPMLEQLRKAYPAALVMIVLSQADARHQATLSVYTDG